MKVQTVFSSVVFSPMRISHHLLWAYLMITSNNDNNSSLPNGPDFHLYGTYQPTLHEVHPKLSLSCFVWNHYSQLPFDIRTQWWTEILLAWWEYLLRSGWISAPCLPTCTSSETQESTGSPCLYPCSSCSVERPQLLKHRTLVHLVCLSEPLFGVSVMDHHR